MNSDKFLEIQYVDGSSRIEKSHYGEIYHIDAITGEKVIKGTRRSDGSYRPDIRVKAGYVPPDEISAFKTKQQSFADKYRSLMQEASIFDKAPVPLGKKKKNRKKSSKNEVEIDEEQAVLQGLANLKLIDNVQAPTSESKPIEGEKKIRNLRKKLREIEELELKVGSDGDKGSLTEEQCKKISRKPQIVEELQELEQATAE